MEARIADNPSLLELLCCCSTSVIVVIVQRAEKVGKEARDVLRARDEIATGPAIRAADAIDVGPIASLIPSRLVAVDGRRDLYTHTECQESGIAMCC